MELCDSQRSKDRTEPWYFRTLLLLLLRLRQQQRPSDLRQRVFTSLSPQRTRVTTRLPWMRGSEAGTEALLLFCASQRQHWAVRPPLPHGQCSVVKPCSSQVQNKHGLAHVFVQPPSILHENFGGQITALMNPDIARLAVFHKYHLKSKSEVWMWAFRTVMNILQVWSTPIPFPSTAQMNLHGCVFEMPLWHTAQ